ncbi:unnamed protein product [Caenorhabditis brenneri]
MENYAGTPCDLARDLNNNPLYQMSLFVEATFGFVSFIGLLWLILTKIINLHFHFNLKLLLIIYYLWLLDLALEFFIGFGYRYLLPFFVHNDCDLLIDPSFFKYFHLGILFAMTCAMLFPIGFAIERFVALKNMKNYENRYKWLGPLIVLSLIVISSLIIWLIYKDETFAGPHYSIVLVPTTSSIRFNVFLYTCIVIHVAVLFIIRSIYRENKRLKAKLLDDQSSTLSMRFLAREVEESSIFVFVICIVHDIFVIFYVINGLIIRIFGPNIFSNPVHFTVARSLYCTFPTFNLLIIFVGKKVLNRLKITRKNTVDVGLHMKSTGEEGIKNYHAETCRDW